MSTSSSPTQERHVLAQLRVLLADDESRIRVLVTRLAVRSGFELTSVSDGQDAVNAFERDPARWDLVILDVTMPTMDGMEAYARINALRSVPTLFLSGCIEEAMAARLVGPVGYMSKPFGVAALVDEMARLTGRA